MNAREFLQPTWWPWACCNVGIAREPGEIALDLPIDLPRPRREAGDPAAAALQARILAAV